MRGRGLSFTCTCPDNPMLDAATIAAMMEIFIVFNPHFFRDLHASLSKCLRPGRVVSHSCRSRRCDGLTRQWRNCEDIGTLNLWNAVELDPYDRAWIQHQDLSLCIIVAFNPTGKFPLSVHKSARLYNAQPHIGRPGRVRCEVDAHASAAQVVLIGTG